MVSCTEYIPLLLIVDVLRIEVHKRKVRCLLDCNMAALGDGKVKIE